MSEFEQRISPALEWMKKSGKSPFPFQLETWQHYLDGDSGMVNAPTGSGKTYSLMVPLALEGLLSKQPTSGIQALWITPIRALAREIQHAGTQVVAGLGLSWQVAIRTGDTSIQDRKTQLVEAPQILITTPESIHLLLATRGYRDYFAQLKAVVVDEWHELMGSKRGVQMELALSRFKTIAPGLKIWGISATIGNMEQAMEVLFGNWLWEGQRKLHWIKSEVKKVIEIQTIMPDEIETYPWTGHLGLRLIEKVIPIIYKSRSTLLFTNTRGQCELWYQKLLDIAPDLAGQMAMHHGSMSRELRDWVENALHDETIKAAVCTSSLDLGVDFRPVETIIQIGSPKGVARFVQRAGRSGHQPGATSKIYFLPTHALEIVEGAALKEAIRRDIMEERIPFIRSFDVLMQYLITLAVSEGFEARQIKKEVQATFSFRSISDEEWDEVLSFTASGGSLDAYEEYKRLGRDKHGIYRITERSIATRHRLSIGTIVGESAMMVKYLSGKNLGNIEEWFISKLNPGDRFWFAGKSLELIRIKENVALVKKSRSQDGRTPSWLGGRMPLSSQLSAMIRFKFDEYVNNAGHDIEVTTLEPLFEVQRKHSLVPRENEFLIESFQDRDGFHLLMYPFEGRYVHEGMGALLSYRLGQIRPMTFSIAMNDYGFELLSDKEIPIEQGLEEGLFHTKRLQPDILASVNAVEMARKRFRDIASIAGLVFKGYPGKFKKEKHLQSSTSLLFEVFKDYDPNNLLYLQAYDEALVFQLEEARLRRALNRISSQDIRLIKTPMPTPFSFPIIVDRMRERMSTEKIEARIERMKISMRGS
ncbi:MAG: ligase-associated DNA damage response DEXH box helicase [Saprospiraceae bacterium]|nr:ligase-associated DNA damage response DEXH box helicase [Saprospiraceae bacterium]